MQLLQPQRHFSFVASTCASAKASADCSAAGMNQPCQQPMTIDTPMACNHSLQSAVNQQANGCASKNCPGQQPGAVYPAFQELNQMFAPQEALEHGTLFPELVSHYPCAGRPNRQVPACLSQVFSLWELRLYLNTHPDDASALTLYRQLSAQTAEPNYATTFDQDSGAGSWEWVCGPWPWQQGANCP